VKKDRYINQSFAEVVPPPPTYVCTAI